MTIAGEKRLNGNHTGLYRVRRGMFGRSILQECIDSPSFTAGRPDSSMRYLRWEDVPYNQAPRALISQLNGNLAVKD